jgi:hypothetical protein
MVSPGDEAEIDFDLCKPVGVEKGCALPSAKAARPSARVW